jgi:hypothetical protein
MPQTCTNSFPKVNDITGDFVCKISQAIIEQESGYFYGSCCKLTNRPSGFGVFVSDSWIRCGKFINGCFAEGKSVSANKRTGELKLVNKRIMEDGSTVQKIESFTFEEVQNGFFINGVKMADVIKRLNFGLDESDWLSMRPIT